MIALIYFVGAVKSRKMYVCVPITIFIYKNDQITAILWLYSIKSIASYQHSWHSKDSHFFSSLDF